MEQINQLRTMRDDALIRLQANPDYRLLTSLDQLIVDLETVVEPTRSGLSVVSAKAETQQKAKVDDVIDKMNAELNGTAAEAVSNKSAKAAPNS
ncbi:MAG: hypothetical protein QNJ29_15170 [Rhizobiaceae bacterium]|nr:hypothetical protein [Rhizobiaceae bacterium]